MPKDKKDKDGIVDNSNKLGNQFDKSGQHNKGIKETIGDIFENISE